MEEQRNEGLLLSKSQSLEASNLEVGDNTTCTDLQRVLPLCKGHKAWSGEAALFHSPDSVY